MQTDIIRHFVRYFTFWLIAIGPLLMHAQIEMESLGLSGEDLTSLDINYGFVAVGSNENGVYWQFEGTATDTGWTQIPLDAQRIKAVYPHKSGPLGWAIGAGVFPENIDDPYVYCSFMGEEFFPNSDGINADIMPGVEDMDGFPDPTICGETYIVGGRGLYRQAFADTVWKEVYAATVEGYLLAVKVREEFPGVVLAGGADGFAGILLIKSTDFGETWDNISPLGTVYDMDFSGAEADTIFVAVSDRVFRTTDGGSSWQGIYDDGTFYHLTEILYNADEDVVYVAGGNTEDGSAILLHSRDFGETWEQIHIDTLGTILDLEFGSDGWIYFATRDDGVYRFRGKTTGIDEGQRGELRRISNFSIYPNPAVSQLQIEFVMLTASNVRLSVMNAMGEELELLVNGRLSTGRHSIALNTAGLVQGVYHITLRIADLQVTRKIVLMD